MIPIQSQDRVVTQNSNVGRSMNYRLDARNLRHIVTMLRDSVYSNKILAVIREYSTNALDAHAASEEAGVVGQRTKPIEVHLPTKFAPELRIRDFGPGLSTKEIEEIYISLGESTKRQSNKYVGSLGFGCKSAFAYGDRFVVTSWNGGRKTVYNNVLDDYVPEGARCDIMAEAPCDPNETGIEICIPIRQNEIEETKQIALNFFKYWTTFPEMTGVSDQEKTQALAFKKNKSIFEGENWTIYPRESSYGNESKGIALMGDVPYKLDWELVKRKLTTSNAMNQNESVLFDFIQANNAILTFEIGALEFSVSRETLQYTDFTCKAIFDRVLLMFESIQKIIEKVIADAKNIWEAKRIYGIIFNRGYGYDADDEKSQFSGELYRLETYFKGRLKWNGQLIQSHQFTEVYRWEVDRGLVTDADPYRNSYTDDSFKCVVTEFRDERGKLRKGSTRRRRRYSYDHGTITPAKGSMVLINDMDKPYGFLTIVRLLLQSGNYPNVKKIYALKFGSEKVRQEFYKHYNFDTVPVTSAKSLLNEAKKWYQTVKPARTYNGGPTGPLQVRVFERDGNKLFGGQHSWHKQDVKLRELKKVNYYVPVDRDEIITNSKIRPRLEPYYFMEYIATLDRGGKWLNGVDVIYGLLPRTVNATWFKDAAKSGKFVNLFDYLQTKVDAVDATQMAEARRYQEYVSNASSYSREQFVVTRYFADAIRPHLLFRDGKMFPLCEALLASYSELLTLDHQLSNLGFKVDVGGVKSTTDYKGLLTEANKQYPILDMFGRSALRSSTTFEPKQIKELAHYINLIDAENGCKQTVK